MDLRGAARTYGDLLLAAGIALLYAVELLLYPGADRAAAIPLGLVAGGVFLVRRRLPLVTFVVAMVANAAVLRFAPAFDANSISFVVVFVLSLYSLGRHAAGHEAWLGILGVAAAVVAFVVGDQAYAASDIFFSIVFCGTPWAAGVAFRLRREREIALTARNEELRAQAEENERRAVVAERARIARELHDVVSHAISVTVLQARGGRKLVGRDDAALRDALDAIEQTNAAALSDMRRLLAVLRDVDTDPAARGAPQPSLTRLGSLVEQVRSSGLEVEVVISGEHDGVPPGVDLSAYRIIQEALTNVIKHAGDRARAEVRVTYGPDGLDIDVSDDGTTPALDSRRRDGRGHGLIGIRERVAVVGGSVEAGPRKTGDGFVVRARLPYSVTA